MLLSKSIESWYLVKRILRQSNLVKMLQLPKRRKLSKRLKGIVRQNQLQVKSHEVLDRLLNRELILHIDNIR